MKKAKNKKYKIIKQPDEMNCGVACLAMICAYYGIENISLAVIREFAKTDREGNSMYSLKFAAEKLHFKAEAYEAEAEELTIEKIQLPAIIHTVVDGLYQHYMVLFEVNRTNVVLGDPAMGQITMKWEEFEQIWTGEFMTFEPTENFKDNTRYKKNYSMIISLIKKYRNYLVELLVITAIMSAISVFTAKFYSYLVDSIIPSTNLKLLVQLLLTTIGIYIFIVALNWVKLKITIVFNKKLDKDLIINIYNRITNLPMSFFSSRTSGDLSSRFEDGNAIREVITDMTLNFVINVVYAIIALVTICVSRSWQLATLSLFMMILVALIHSLFKNKMMEQMTKAMKADTEVYSFANASFMGSETIKSYNSETLIENTMTQKYKEYQEILYSTQKFSQIQSSLISTIMQICNLFMLTVLGLLVMEGKISIGQLMYLYTLIGYMIAPLDDFVEIQDSMYEINASLDRLDDVFRSTTEKELNKNRQNLKEKIESIEFKNVSFHYGLRDEILENISFNVKEGESIGVIGSSGSGKTTLIKLILNFYSATGGEIYINDFNINKITTSSLRKKIAYVSQNDFWFQDTIFNNLTIGNKDADVSQVIKVLETVQMSEYIGNKAYGLNAMIEEGGTNLSTGEKQRLSLAKALLTNPDVLILDESTSNLDAKTEELIINSLSNEKDKIKIVIAHRLNTLARCDKIIAIKDGKIEEAGTPLELIEQKGMFYTLWNAQNQTLNEINKKTNEI